MGKFREAIPWFEKGIELNPIIPPRYLSHLAWSYFWLGKTKKSVIMLRRAATHYPEYAGIRAILALALLPGSPKRN